MIPPIVNHIAPFFSINSPNLFPNKKVKYATRKNLSPRVKRQIKKNITILKPIIPLVIVNTLNGNGVKPARNIIPNQSKKPPLEDILSYTSNTLFSYP